MTNRTAAHEISTWFFEIYLPDWIRMGANPNSNENRILDYWNTPLHAASVNMTKCLHTGEEVIDLLRANQAPLREANYTHTVVLDRVVTGFNLNAGSIEVIWSRRTSDESEIERRAVHFDIHRTEQGWRVVTVASTLTDKTNLAEIWETIKG